jgi:hypothetical protein
MIMILTDDMQDYFRCAGEMLFGQNAADLVELRL